MRDRLIELLKSSHKAEQLRKMGVAVGTYKEDCVEAMVADFLIAKGVIVPPCKRGDIVYCIRKDKSRIPFIKEVEVRSVTVYGVDRFSVYTTKDDVWGQTAFATFEEAEIALAERSKG